MSKLDPKKATAKKAAEPAKKAAEPVKKAAEPVKKAAEPATVKVGSKVTNGLIEGVVVKIYVLSVKRNRRLIEFKTSDGISEVEPAENIKLV